MKSIKNNLNNIPSVELLEKMLKELDDKAEFFKIGKHKQPKWIENFRDSADWKDYLRLSHHLKVEIKKAKIRSFYRTDIPKGVDIETSEVAKLFYEGNPSQENKELFERAFKVAKELKVKVTIGGAMNKKVLEMTGATITPFPQTRQILKVTLLARLFYTSFYIL